MSKYDGKLYSCVLILVLTILTSIVFGQDQAIQKKEETDHTREILEKVISTYQSLNSFKTKGTIVTYMIWKGYPVQVSKTFEILLAKPNLYKITWTETPHCGPHNKNVIWDSGDGPYFYSSGIKGYFKLKSLEEALSFAQQIQGVYAQYIPYLFFKTEEKLKIFKDYKFQGEQEVAGVPCYTILGKLPKGQETLWILKNYFLFRKAQVQIDQKLLKENLEQMESYEVTDDMVQQMADSTGLEPTEENKENLKRLLDFTKRMIKEFVPQDVDTIEVFIQTLKNPVLKKNDFEFRVPQDVKLKDSFFETILNKVGDKHPILINDKPKEIPSL